MFPEIGSSRLPVYCGIVFIQIVYTEKIVFIKKVYTERTIFMKPDLYKPTEVLKKFQEEEKIVLSL